MKQKFIKIGSFLVMAAAIIFSATSCGDKDDPKASLTIEPKGTKTVVAAGEEFDLVVTVKETTWTAASDTEWATIDKTTGDVTGTIKVTVAPNSGEPRTAKITVKSADDKITEILTIEQAKADVPVPAQAGEIQGDSEGVGSVELSVEVIEHAATYVWRRDGVEIRGEEGRTLTATQSGSYEVCGKNSLGQEGLPSPPKVVTIQTVADLLAGDWSGYTWYFEAEGSAITAEIELSYEFSMTKVSDTQLLCNGGIGFHELYNPGYPETWDSFLIDVNPDGTITIPPIALEGFALDASLETYICAFHKQPAGEYFDVYNWMRAWENLPVTNASGDLIPIEFNGYPDFVTYDDGSGIPGSWLPLAGQNGEAAGWFGVFFCDMEWEKIDADAAPRMLRAPKTVKSVNTSAALNPVYASTMGIK